MKISELIEELKELKEEHGDLEVWTESLNHRWAPDLVVRRRAARRDEGKELKFLVLNG